MKNLSKTIEDDKLSQREAAFLILLQANEEFVPTFKFVGYRSIKKCKRVPYGRLTLLSYKTPCRLSTMYYELDQIEREEVTGITGAIYYQYRFVHKNLDTLPEYYKKLI